VDNWYSLAEEYLGRIPASSIWDQDGRDLDPFIFGIGALLFYGLLVRARLVPRWLSLWGLAGAALVFAAGLSALLSTFGALQYALAVPIGVQEMVLASWLILVGFNSTRTEIERGTGIDKSTPAASA
jgi:hypothetical protein